MSLQQHHQQQPNQFDRLPDAVVRLIFNKLRDAKSLCQSTLVCKRFASIAPQADTIFLSVPRKSIFAKQSLHYHHHHHHHITESTHGHGSKKLLKSLVRKLVTRPLRFLLRFRSSASGDDRCSYHSPHQILRNFEEIQSLRVELPGYGGDVQSNGDDSLLKWRAEFGSDLQNCVILGAKSFYTRSRLWNHSEENEEQHRQSDEDLLLTGDDLKLRVVWTISCLISASERHYLLHRIVSEHPTIRSLLATDASNQGRLRMSGEQIEELRSKVNSSAKLESPAGSERTPVPALRIKLWYAPALELPAFGSAMEGATLVVIRPVEGAKNAESDGDLVTRVFNGHDEGGDDEKVIGEAARELMNKNNIYTLEMNAF